MAQQGVQQASQQLVRQPLPLPVCGVRRHGMGRQELRGWTTDGADRWRGAVDEEQSTRRQAGQSLRKQSDHPDPSRAAAGAVKSRAVKGQACVAAYAAVEGSSKGYCASGGRQTAKGRPRARCDSQARGNMNLARSRGTEIRAVSANHPVGWRGRPSQWLLAAVAAGARGGGVA